MPRMSAEQSNGRAMPSRPPSSAAWAFVVAFAPLCVECRAPRNERGTAPSTDAATSASASASTSLAAPPSAAPTTAAPPSASSGATAAPGPLNVLVLTIDSLRADVPWLGYGRPIAPNLTRLAETGLTIRGV